MTLPPQSPNQYNGTTVSGRATQDGASRLAAGVLAAALVLQLVSIWSVTYLPTQDGPVHLEIAAQLAALRSGDAGLLDRYYQANPRPEPNWLVYPPLGALARLAGWVAAERTIVSLYLIGLPLALAYALSAVRRDAVFLAVFAIPLGATYLFHMGFVNFSLSVPLGLLTLGYGLRHPPRLDRLGRLAILALLMLVTGVAHAVSACAAVAVLAAAGAWRGAVGPPDARGKAQGFLRGLASPLVAALPVLALVLVFVTGPSHHAISWQSPLDLLRRFLFLHVLVSFDRVELVPAVGCAALLFELALLRLAGRRRLAPAERGDELLVAVAALVALYFVLPASLAGGGYLNPRLQLWAVLAGILWLGAAPWTAERQRIVVAAVGVFGVAFIAMHATAYRRLSPYLAEFVSVAPAIAEDSTVLPLSFVGEDWRLRDPTLSGYKVRPFEHALGYVACRKRIVDLTEYQADQGYFPILYRPGENPYRTLVPEEGVAEDALRSLDWNAYERGGGRVDYVLLWARAVSTARPGETEFLDRLGQDFEPVFTSSPRGLAELYRRRPLPAR